MGWREQAACSPHTEPSYPTEWFIPTEEYLDGDTRWKPFDQGQQVCLSICPVVVDCLITHAREAYGVWGGVRPSQRVQFHRDTRNMEEQEIRIEAMKLIAATKKRRKIK